MGDFSLGLLQVQTLTKMKKVDHFNNPKTPPPNLNLIENNHTVTILDLLCNREHNKKPVFIKYTSMFGISAVALSVTYSGWTFWPLILLF